MAVMGNVQKKKHIFYNLNRKKKRSGKKYKKVIDWYISLLKRQDKEGPTLWIQKTMPKAESRLRRYGVSAEQVHKALEHKGLKKLISSVNFKNV